MHNPLNQLESRSRRPSRKTLEDEDDSGQDLEDSEEIDGEELGIREIDSSEEHILD